MCLESISSISLGKRKYLGIMSGLGMTSPLTPRNPATQNPSKRNGLLISISSINFNSLYFVQFFNFLNKKAMILHVFKEKVVKNYKSLIFFVLFCKILILF